MNVKSKQQFKYMFNNNKNIKIRLLKKLAEHKLINNKYNTIEDWDNIINGYINNGDNDEVIYSNLRKLFHKDKNFENVGRAVALANNIIKFIPKNSNINSLLDYGCANGIITEQLGKILKIEKVYGADVKDYNIQNLHFILLKKNNLMPEIEDSSIDLITCSMVLHHVENVDSTLKEFKRILSKNGLIIIREHNCETKNFSVFLDIIHGLYSLVWSDPIEDETFINTYYANYKTKKEWSNLFLKYGFIKTYEFDRPNTINAYYSVFKLI